MKIYLSEIKLVIKGSGNCVVLNNPTPSEVIINGVIKNPPNKRNICDKDINNVIIKFDNLIESCARMFSGLTNIIEIDLSNFDASRVKNMESMFFSCSNLKKINFGNINTSSVTTMKEMFSHCESLTSLDVSNFDTQKVENMYDMFAYNYKLITVNVSNFKTTKVKVMQGIFFYCYKLKYLDISSFEYSSITNMKRLFADDVALVYIKFKSFIIKGDPEFDWMFRTISPYLRLCLDDVINSYTKNLLNGLRARFNCTDRCFGDNPKIDLKSNSCVKSCNDSDYKYELNTLCYEKCPNSTFSPDDNEYFCREKSPENNYYFDKVKMLFRECYSLCKSCNYGGNETNHNCTECKQGFYLLDEPENNGNCYKDPIGYYLDLDNNIYRKCYNTCESCNENGNETNHNCIECKQGLYFLDNQKNNLNSNMTSIDLGECESSLRQAYNLSNNETIYIKMLEISQEEMKISKIEYDLYAKKIRRSER